MQWSHVPGYVFMSWPHSAVNKAGSAWWVQANIVTLTEIPKITVIPLIIMRKFMFRCRRFGRLWLVESFTNMLFWNLCKFLTDLFFSVCRYTDYDGSTFRIFSMLTLKRKYLVRTRGFYLLSTFVTDKIISWPSP